MPTELQSTLQILSYKKNPQNSNPQTSYVRNELFYTLTDHILPSPYYSAVGWWSSTLTDQMEWMNRLLVNKTSYAFIWLVASCIFVVSTWMDLTSVKDSCRVTPINSQSPELAFGYISHPPLSYYKQYING